jgi:RecA/RadA recombinase
MTINILYSFDKAFENRKGEIGFPVGKGLEVFGPTNCGKSTIVYGLAGILASADKKFIALADLEGFDPDFLTTVLENAKFSGDVQYIQKGTDEEVLDTLAHYLRDDTYCVGILDSIGAISPISEQEGEIGEANMGRRAKILAQFCRKAIKIIRDKGEDAPTIFMINHAYPRIGGLGISTPGGEVKKYLSSMRVQVKRVYYKNKYEEYPDGSYVIEGKIDKNRWGFKGRKFWLFVLSGKGIHLGLTAMYDGIRLGLVGRQRSISIGEKKFGSLKKIIEKAQEGDDKFFKPFFEVLRNQEQDKRMKKNEYNKF